MESFSSFFLRFSSDFCLLRVKRYPKSFQKAHTISREHSRPLGRGSHGSTRQRTPTKDINLKKSGSESTNYRIRWRSTGREDLRGFGWNPLDALDYSL